MGKTVINGHIFSASSDSAVNILYRNKNSKLKAENVQKAIDELANTMTASTILSPTGEKYQMGIDATGIYLLPVVDEKTDDEDL